MFVTTVRAGNEWRCQADLGPAALTYILPFSFYLEQKHLALTWRKSSARNQINMFFHQFVHQIRFGVSYPGLEILDAEMYAFSWIWWKLP